MALIILETRSVSVPYVNTLQLLEFKHRENRDFIRNFTVFCLNKKGVEKYGF